MGGQAGQRVGGVAGSIGRRGQQAVNASSLSSTFLALFLEHFQLPSGWSDNLRNEMYFVFLHMRLDLGYVKKEKEEGGNNEKMLKIIVKFSFMEIAKKNQCRVEK